MNGGSICLVPLSNPLAIRVAQVLKYFQIFTNFIWSLIAFLSKLTGYSHSNTSMGPEFLRWVLPNHLSGPIDLSIEVADDFAWAQNFFGESCRSIWMGPLISSQKWPMISYGLRISLVSPAEASGWAHWSPHRSGRWFCMGPGFLWWVLPKHLSGPRTFSTTFILPIESMSHSAHK